MKKYDPLWEIVGQKHPLQGVEEDVDALCPVCHTTLHVGAKEQENASVECGLCGAELVVSLQGGAHLEIAPEEILTEDQEVPAEAEAPRGEMGEPTPDVP